MDKLYTVEEVSQMLQIGKHTVYRWIKRGWIKAVVLPNGQIRIPKKEIDRVLTTIQPES
jgi:excisionase family DNA binding protein